MAKENPESTEENNKPKTDTNSLLNSAKKEFIDN
jgi:hypothetical protein